MKFLIKLKKCISIITASCLLISFVIGPTTANAMTNEEATAKYKQIFKDFMLPYNYGQITSAHYAGTDRVIINIQDLHCHPKVQKNISNIIETFDKNYGVKKVYLEGAYGNVSTKWLIDRLDNSNKMEMLDKILETGRLTGAEYYSAMTGKANIINGLEEKAPYLDNLKRFGEIIENQDNINLILQAIDDSLLKLKQQYYTKRQYKLEELSNNYREGKISSQKYYALLYKHIDKLGIDISKYENMFTYMMLLELQKKLDYSKITNELQNLVLFLRENLPNSAYQMLVDNTENFSKMDKLYGYVVRISRQLNLDLTVNFPNLDNYFGYIEFSQKINPLQLIVEEKKLTEEINTRFSETKAQREVVFLINFTKYLKDYVASKITSDDYVYYKENIDTCRQLWNKYVDNRVLSLLDEYIVQADKFYKINTDRNIYFTKNMFKESDELNKIETEVEAKGDVNKIIENMKGVKEVDVVITGGFHSQTVTEILKNHGVSYIVITPNVTEGTKLAEETYYEIAKEQSKISFQAFANLITSLLPPSKQQEIFNLMSKKTKQRKKNIKKLSEEQRKEMIKIAAAKLLESDDAGDVLEEVKKELNKYTEEPISDKFLEKQGIKKIKKILEKDQQNISTILSTLNKTSTQQALVALNDMITQYIDFFKIKEEKLKSTRKGQLIEQINALPKLSEMHKKLLMSRGGKHNRILTELSEYDYENLEQYSEEQLENCLQLIKELWNISEITSADEVRKEIEISLAKVEMFFAFIGYSAPQGDYENISLAVLAPLMDEISKILGKERFGILSSPTTDVGSIDATSTVLSQMYDALMVYVTAVDYLKYIEPEKFPDSEKFEEIEKFVGQLDKESLIRNGTNLTEFMNAFKFVAENGKVYSEAVAQTKNVPNFAVIIGGRATALEKDFMNAQEQGNNIFLINSRKLAKQSQAPAIEHKKVSDLSTPYILNNSVQFLLDIITLMNDGLIKDGKLIRTAFFEFTEEEQSLFKNLEEKKKELNNKRTNLEANKNNISEKEKFEKEISKLEQEIDDIEKRLGSLKIFYNLLVQNPDIFENEKVLINFLTENKVKSVEDLERLKIHVIDMNDENCKTDEQLKEEGKKTANKIFEIVKKFIKKAKQFEEKDWIGSVISTEIEVQAFDLNYAIKEGYLDGPKKDFRGYEYYVLKPKFDKNKHFSARIYKSERDNKILKARTDISVDPMFVIYSNGSVGFMSREKFNKIYRTNIGKSRTRGRLFKSIKNEQTVEVSFVEPMSIIDTDEGRDTVLPFDIVVKKDDSKPYSMSIAEFEKIYPKEKNPEFYEQNKEEIAKRENAYRDFYGADNKDKQDTNNQQQSKKERKKFSLKRIIAGLLITVNLFFSKPSAIPESSDTTNAQQVSSTRLTTIPTKIILKILMVKKQSDIEYKIINLLENWQIMLGIFFPVVKKMFVRMHTEREEDVKETLDFMLYNVAKINADVGEALRDAVGMNFIEKIIGFATLIARKYTREDFADIHTKVNKGLIYVEEAAEEVSFYEHRLYDEEGLNKILKNMNKYSDEEKDKIIDSVFDFVDKNIKNKKANIDDMLDSLILKVTSDSVKLSKKQKNLIFENLIKLIKFNDSLSIKTQVSLLERISGNIDDFELEQDKRDNFFDECFNFFIKDEKSFSQLMEKNLWKAEFYSQDKLNKFLNFLLEENILDKYSEDFIYPILLYLDNYETKYREDIFKVAINYLKKNIKINIDIDEQDSMIESSVLNIFMKIPVLNKVLINYLNKKKKNISIYEQTPMSISGILNALINNIPVLNTEQREEIFLLAINKSKNNYNKDILAHLLKYNKYLDINQQQELYSQINNSINDLSINNVRQILKALPLDEFSNLNEELQTNIINIAIKKLDFKGNNDNSYNVEKYAIRLLETIFEMKDFLNEEQKKSLTDVILKFIKMKQFTNAEKNYFFEIVYENIDLLEEHGNIKRIEKELDSFKLKFFMSKIGKYTYSPLLLKIKDISQKVSKKSKFFNLEDISSQKNEAINNFQIYKNLEMENLKVLKLLMNLSSQTDLETIKKLLIPNNEQDMDKIEKNMFDCYRELSQGIQSKYKEMKNLQELIIKFFEQDNIDITKQKDLHGYDIETIFKAKLEDITINDLINVIHQTSIKNFKDRMSFIHKKEFTDSVFVQNFSKDGYINPEIKKLLSKIPTLDGATVCFDEDTLVISITPIDKHSTTIVVNTDNINRGISFSFYDIVQKRGVTVENMLKSLGFDSKLQGALVNAKLDKSNGLSEDVDLVEKFDLLLKMFYLTVKYDETAYNLYGIEDYTKKYTIATDNDLYEDGNLDKLYTIVDNLYSSVREKSLFNTKENLDAILKQLGLPEIPNDESVIYEEPASHIKFLGQMGINKYFNAVIDRAFSEGRIVIDENGNLVKNDKYNEAENIKKLLDGINNTNQNEILEQASIIDELNKQNVQILKLETKARIGQLEYQTGYLQLSNGEYLFIKVLKNPINGMIRYASVESVLSSVQRDTKLLTVENFAKKITNEGYRVKADVRKKSKDERKTFFDELKVGSDKQETETKNISVPGKLMGVQKSNVVGRVVFDFENFEKYKGNKDNVILFKEYLEPNDMKWTINADGIVLTSGAELSHQGLIVKEKGIPATIIRDLKFLKDKKGKRYAKIRYVIYKKIEIEGLEDFTVEEIAEEQEIVVEEGANVEIDGKTGRLILLDEKEYKEKQKKYKLLETKGEQKVKKTTKKSGRIIDVDSYTGGNISDYIKSFSDAIENKSYFGTKSTTLQEMSNVIKNIINQLQIKGRVPNGVMIGYGVFFKILQEIGVFEEFKQLYGAIKKGEEGLDEANRAREKIMEKLNNLTQKDKNELMVELNKYIDFTRVTKYAVRSAFVGEDGSSFSSAGVGESVVGVSGEKVVDSLIDVVLKSMFSERSVAYQCSTGQAFLPAALIQEAVDSEKSAVMLVRGNKITISGSWGQGEIVVSGEKIQSTIEIEVDENIDLENWDEDKIFEYIRNHPDCIKIVDYKTERQDYKYGLNGEVKKISDEDSTRELFSEEEIESLSKLGISLLKEYRKQHGTDYKKGADIEIAMEKGVINVVQIRPVTEETEQTAEEFEQEKIVGQQKQERIVPNKQNAEQQKTESLVNNEIISGIKRSGIDAIYGDFVSFIQKNGGSFSLFEEFYHAKNKGQKSFAFDKPFDKMTTEELENFINNTIGYSLGFNFYRENKTYNDLYVVDAISAALNLCTWEPYYRYYETKYTNKTIRTTDEHLRNLIEDCKKTNKKIYMFVPPEIFSLSDEEIEEMADSYFDGDETLKQYQRKFQTNGATLEEILWFKQHPENLKYVEFVFGAYDYFNVPSEQFFNEHLKGSTKQESIVKLSELYRKIFAGEINLNETKTLDAKEEQKSKLVHDIMSEYDKFTNYRFNQFTKIIPELLKKESIEFLTQYLDFLISLDKNYKYIHGVYSSFKDFLQYTKDNKLILSLCKDEISLEYFFNTVKLLKLGKENSGDFVIIENSKNKRYSIEILPEYYDGIYGNTKFKVKDLETGVIKNLSLSDIKEEFNISFESENSSIFIVPFNVMNENIKIYLDSKGKTKIQSQQEQESKEVEFKTFLELVQTGANPTKLVHLTVDALIEELFNVNDNMKGKNIIVEDGMIISEELRKTAAEQGINIVTLKISNEKDKDTRGGKVIDEQHKIRMSFNSAANELTVYSKQGISLSVEAIKELIEIAYSEGRKDLSFKDGQIIAFAEGTEQTIKEITNRIEISRKAGIIKAETEINFDIENEHFSVNKCEQEHNATGANTFTLLQDRVNESDIPEIKRARQEGYRIRLSYKYNNINDIPSTIEYDGIQIDATKVKTKKEAEEILDKLQKMCNVEKTISVEFSKDVYKLLEYDIFKKHGVLPIVDSNSIEDVKGKKEVKKITDITNIEQILANDEIVGVIVDSENKSLFSIIKGLFKIKTSKYEKGLNVGLREVQDENNRYSLDDILKLKDILLKGNIESSDISLLSSVLAEEDVSYLNYLFKKEKDKENKEETFGFIVGRAMRTMKQQWQTKFTNIDDSLFTKEAKGQYEKGLLLLMLSIQLSDDENINIIQELLDKASTVEDRGWNMTAEEMYNILGKEATEIITRVLNENDKKIKKLESEELAKAKEDFGILNNIIQDRFRTIEESKEIKISVLTVRSILAAA